MNIVGTVAIVKFVDSTGKRVSFDKAAKYGWVTPLPVVAGRLQLGHNTFTDQGRQALAYAFGGQSPSINFACTKFGIGTGTTPPATTDTELEAALEFNAGGYTKMITGVTWPSPFVVEFRLDIGVNDGNGYLITELGLFSGLEQLLARKTLVGLNKSQDFAPTLSYSIRM